MYNIQKIFETKQQNKIPTKYMSMQVKDTDVS